MQPRFKINTSDYIHVDETFFISRPTILEFNSECEVDNETLNSWFANFEEELEEEVEIENQDLDDTPNSLATKLPH